MKHPIADKFKIGEFSKPSFKKEEFYKGGFYSMVNRMKLALRPFPGAFSEFSARSEDLSISEAISIMRDYVIIE